MRERYSLHEIDFCHLYKISVEEAVAAHAADEGELRRRLRDGSLPHFKLRNLTLVDRRDVERLAAG